MITVAEIASHIAGATFKGDPNAGVESATHDSRQVEPGCLFAVLRGQKTDGRRFVEPAIQNGASALLVDEAMPVDIPQIIVQDTRQALGLVAAACFGFPTSKLDVVGITGTNGKTTTAYLVEAALFENGARPGVMSTVEYRYGSECFEANLTTPEATIIQGIAKKMADADTTHLIMEASSHGLTLGRLVGCRFLVVAFTNLSQDHLDFHGNMKRYGEAKLKLFTSAIENEPQARAVVNADDAFSKTIVTHLKHPVVTVSIDCNSTADIRPKSAPRYDIDGIEAELLTPKGACLLRSPLLGPHNLANLLTGLGICLQLDMPPSLACQGLGRLDVVPGRLERVKSSQPFAVLVDYAHTPDALRRVLDALRPLTKGRLISVFGCGGDRDPTKRPLMGTAVKEGADVAIVTSDNPRTEDPDTIVEMIIPGIEDKHMPKIDIAELGSSRRGFAVALDRRTAINVAINTAKPSDTVLIAGKGHEDYQILGTEKIHFDDREEAQKALAALGGGSRV